MSNQPRHTEPAAPRPTEQARVLAVCRVVELRPDDGEVGVTAIHKRPVDGPVQVKTLGLYRDIQADRKNHGGANKAVYAYAQEAADRWRDELADTQPGIFGENLRTSGLDVDGAVIGERWRIGDTLVVEVTMPRIPCQTFGRYLGQGSWPKRFTAKGYAGAYLRVVERGPVQAGDPIEVIARPAHGVTVQRWFTQRAHADARALLDAERDGQLSLAGELRDYLLARVAQPGNNVVTSVQK